MPYGEIHPRLVPFSKSEIDGGSSRLIATNCQSNSYNNSDYYIWSLSKCQPLPEESTYQSLLQTAQTND